MGDALPEVLEYMKVATNIHDTITPDGGKLLIPTCHIPTAVNSQFGSFSWAGSLPFQNMLRDFPARVIFLLVPNCFALLFHHPLIRKFSKEVPYQLVVGFPF